MKKQYIIPDMTVVKIGATVLAPASSLDKNDGVISSNDAVLCRGFLDFEDDEEE